LRGECKKKKPQKNKKKNIKKKKKKKKTEKEMKNYTDCNVNISVTPARTNNPQNTL